MMMTSSEASLPRSIRRRWRPSPSGSTRSTRASENSRSSTRSIAVTRVHCRLDLVPFALEGQPQVVGDDGLVVDDEDAGFHDHRSGDTAVTR